MSNIEPRIIEALKAAGITKGSSRRTKIPAVIDALTRKYKLSPEQKQEAERVAREWVG